MAYAIQRGNPIVGNLFEFVKSPLLFINQTATLGDTVHFRLGPFPAYLFRQPEAVHDVLVTHADKFNKDFMMKGAGRKFFGNGLVLNDGDSHRKQRKRLQPSFYHNRLEGYSKIIVEEAVKAVESWHEGEKLEFDTKLTEIMLRIVSRAMMNSSVPSDMETIHKVMEDFHEVFSKEVRSPLLTVLPDWLPTEHKRKLRHCVKMLDAMIWQMINTRRIDNEDKGDLLSTLLSTAGENNVEENKQLRDEVITLFVAGHETTTNLLSWTIYLLTQHPEVEAKLRAEITSVLQGRLPTFTDLHQFQYTDMVLKETMRLYPPAWLFGRQATQDVTICGTPIKSGQLVYLSSYVIQRDPRYFENPDEFIPERFANDAEKHLPVGAYFPFGDGPRICIGQSFAMMEAALCLGVMMPKIHLSLLNSKPVELFGSVTLRPKDHLDVEVQLC
jgi:cytochrome P450